MLYTEFDFFKLKSLLFEMKADLTTGTWAKSANLLVSPDIIGDPANNSLDMITEFMLTGFKAAPLDFKKFELIRFFVGFNKEEGGDVDAAIILKMMEEECVIEFHNMDDKTEVVTKNYTDWGQAFSEFRSSIWNELRDYGCAV